MPTELCGFAARCRAGTVLLALTLIGAALAAPAAAPAAGWLPPQPLSQPGDSGVAAQVVLDPDGNSLAAWTSIADSGSRVEVRFRPAGGAFGPAVPVSRENHSAGAPRLGVDARGDVVAAWDLLDGSGSRVVAAQRPAGGAFSPGVPISAGGQPVGGQQIAVDPAGNAVVAWIREEGAESRVEAAFRPAGGFFEAAAPISVAGGKASQLQLALDARGEAVAVWKNDAANAIEAAFRPAGAEFGLPVPISPPDATEPHVAVDPAGNAIAIWMRSSGFLAEAAFRPAGGSFQPPVPITPAGDGGGEPRVAFDRHGNALAVWNRAPDAVTANRIETAFRPAGGEFGQLQPVSPAGVTALEPQVALDAEGDALAVWSTSGPGARAEAAIRPAGGAFGPAMPISPSSMQIGDPGVAVDPRGNAVAVWHRRTGPLSFVAEAAAFDATPPTISNISVPDRARVGEPIAVSAAASDWSGQASIAWSFGDGGSAGGTHAAHAFRSAGDYEVTVTATDPVGDATSATRTVTVEAQAPGREGEPDDRTAPAMSRLAVSPRSFRVTRGGARASRRKGKGKGKVGARVGTTIRYRLGEAATVRFTVRRATIGRRLGRKCLRGRAGNRKRRRCARFVSVRGALSAAGAEGRNRLFFSGRLGGKPLRPGRYQLLGSATDAAGNRSQAQPAAFRVIRPPGRSR